MKLRTSLKQQLRHNFLEIILAALGCYAVLSIYFICVALSYANEPIGAIMLLSGHDIAFVIIIAFFAFYGYKSELNMCFQLSNSKIGLFWSKLISGFIACVSCSVISLLYTFGVNTACKNIINTSNLHIEVRPFFTDTIFYRDWHEVYFFGKDSNTRKILLGILTMLFVSFAVYVICLLIAGLFYRVNLVAKLLIILLPIGLIYFGIPIIDMFATHGALSESYNNAFYTMLGMTDKSPLIPCLICIGLSIASSIGLYFVMKTSQIKK